MPILIDGHNLIGRMPDIDLADPDDEAELVLKLRTYCARTGKRVTVVFDHGLPGGKSHELSSGKVDVRFASTGRTADGVLLERIRKSNNPRNLTIVTSDRRIISGAEARGVRVIRSEAFAELLSTSPKTDGVSDDGEKPTADGDVGYWLRQFEQRS
jgi:predicted RNA-binding protein with PIN domain